ncbi:MAG TPA: superoxide dismutase [Fimbriiglobus sp.]|nr:superoxide dismutase [Fimbriiglobus sp.]
MITRREMLQTAAAGAALAAVPTLFATAKAQAKTKVFTLPKLPYAYDALEPSIDAETMKIHHDIHHQGYVNNLNKALAGMPDWLSKPVGEVITHLKELPEKVRIAVRNNGGGHYNHSFFWQVMTRPGGPGPKGDLLKAIESSFGGLDGFKKAFTTAATGRFGSGWAWLIPGKDKPLAIVSSPNQDNPLMAGGPRPILGVDVWEHAYYLKYHAARGKYVEAWYNVVNWDHVAANFARKR